MSTLISAMHQMAGNGIGLEVEHDWVRRPFVYQFNHHSRFLVSVSHSYVVCVAFDHPGISGFSSDAAEIPESFRMKLDMLLKHHPTREVSIERVVKWAGKYKEGAYRGGYVDVVPFDRNLIAWLMEEIVTRAEDPSGLCEVALLKDTEYSVLACPGLQIATSQVVVTVAAYRKGKDDDPSLFPVAAEQFNEADAVFDRVTAALASQR